MAELEVPDPASRAQAGDIDSHSVVVDPLAYQWQHNTWQGRPWNEAIIYSCTSVYSAVTAPSSSTCRASLNSASRLLN